MSDVQQSSQTDQPTWEKARDDGARLLDKRQFDGAVETLQQAIAADPTGESHALLGLAEYQREQYGAAVTHYVAALEHNPDNADWQQMLAQARANMVSEVHVPVPEFHYFDPEQLLAPAAEIEDVMPAPLPPLSKPRMLKRVKSCLGTLLGWTATAGVNVLGFIWGKTVGYRDQVWTNWYRRPRTLALLTLMYMRDRLNVKNLKSVYPRGSLTGFQKKGQSPPPGVAHFRTADGSWNNLKDPKEGAAGTRFLRNVANDAIRPESGAELMSPNPREISRVLLTREFPMKEVPFLNLLAACWIQFENHDWVHHGEIRFDDPLEIPLADDDPLRNRYRQDRLYVGRTQADPTRRPPDETPATYINEVTHWWDGSQVYGSDVAMINRLRSGVDGKLALREDGTLPIGDNGVEVTGFLRTWWVGLSMLHTLFAREHNSICDRLKQRYPHWEDQRLFQVARLINAAVMAKIHSVEWTPAILPNRALSSALHGNWYGLLTNLLRDPQDRRTVAETNVRNPELGGVVGNPINKHGCGFGLTEEFVEVYRLHSLLPETLVLKEIGGDGSGEVVPLTETRQAASKKIVARFPMPDLFYSFGTQHPGQLVLNNFPKFMQELSIPGNPLFDMGAIDILRARERGVPRYNEFRRQLGLNPIRSFDDLTDDQSQVSKLKSVYGDRPEDVEKLDLLIGTLAEGHRPTGFGFGETMFQIFILNATRRLQADRFYTDNYNEQTYTKEGLDWIDDADLKTVLLRNYPELARTGLANIKNAFEPWDPDPNLDPHRHPLRRFDPMLKPDPWRGDATK